jgi:hypothetical protein
VAAIAAGIRWHRPPRRAAWWLIAAAQGLFVAGDALFSINELVLGIEPFPSLADALYLPGYPALVAGLARRLGGEPETIVYRVAQEAVLNVTRHAQAKRLSLELEGAGDRVQLCIRDDGVGFDPVGGADQSSARGGSTRSAKWRCTQYRYSRRPVTIRSTSKSVANCG